MNSSSSVKYNKYSKLWLALVIATNSNAWFGTAVVVTNMRNFPLSRGTVSGILKGYAGISAAVYTVVYSLVLKGSASNLLLFLTLVIPILCLAMMYFIRPCTPASGEDSSEHVHFLFTQAAVILLAIYLLATAIIETVVSLSDAVSYILAAIVVIFLISPLAIPVKMTIFPSRPKKNLPSDSSDHLVLGEGETTPTDPLLTPSSSVTSLGSFYENDDASDVEILLAMGEGAVKKKRRPKRGEDFKIREALIKADFWLLWVVYFLGVGSGVTILNNLAQIGVAFGLEDTTILLALFSFCNFVGRIGSGAVSEHFVSPDGAHGGALTTVSGKSNVTEQPLERLIKAVKSLSPKALSASVGDIGSVVSMIDRIAGSAPGNGSRAAAGEDLVAMTKCRLQARNYITQDGMTGSRKMRRHTSAMPLNVVSSAGSVSDSFKQFTGPETSDLESTATSSVKRPRIEANHALLEEIREINQRLIDTVVDISDEDVDSTAVAATAEGGEGTIVKCSFSAVALSQNLKSQYASAQMSPIQPLRLLVPTNYPSCSPILLDRFPVEVSKEYEDLSIKAKSRFSISLRSLSQPMSLGEIARTWDVCARAVISEHAQQSGGGTFSSKYGSWENCLSAA
ncbi:hypothetical protein NC652_007805 [Populus alba x Populus x berolinensis]|nr:hypothetical protein NC652_007805 [Populus alba x Populus x berolinensis]